MATISLQDHAMRIAGTRQRDHGVRQKSRVSRLPERPWNLYPQKHFHRYAQLESRFEPPTAGACDDGVVKIAPSA